MIYKESKPVLKGVFFDFDGTLVDSEPLHFQAEKLVLNSRGISFELTDKKDLIGGTVKGTAERICARYGIQDIENFFIERESVFHKLVESTLELMPGARSLIEILAHHGVLIALVTSGTPNYVLSFLDKHQITKSFHSIVTMEDVELHKPYADPYLKALELTSLQSNESIAIEDSPTGVMSTQKAKIPCIYIDGGESKLASDSDSILRVKTLESVNLQLLNDLHTKNNT
ncbi:MAG: hypothetical protein CL904_06545 [Dehalococcoidia bacterium]|nr:hypothetical protein [Dehalococcoidia bacterium]MQG16282.1 HAD family phosphatase [SAR202 cluster bacterium]